MIGFEWIYLVVAPSATLLSIGTGGDTRRSRRFDTVQTGRGEREPTAIERHTHDDFGSWQSIGHVVMQSPVLQFKYKSFNYGNF